MQTQNIYPENVPALVVSHAHIDHCNGIIDLLRDFRRNRVNVGILFRPIPPIETDPNIEITTYAQQHSPSHFSCIDIDSNTDVWELPSSRIAVQFHYPFYINLSSPGNETTIVNNSSVYMTLFVRGQMNTFHRAIVFSGDLELWGQNMLYTSLLDQQRFSQIDAYCYKVPHHGSRNGNYSAISATVNPSVAIITGSDDNSPGVPDYRETVDVLSRFTGPIGVHFTAQHNVVVDFYEVNHNTLDTRVSIR